MKPDIYRVMAIVGAIAIIDNCLEEMSRDGELFTEENSRRFRASQAALSGDSRQEGK